jgi:hypothetical protein
MGIYLPNIEMPRKGEMLVIFPDGTSYVCFNGIRERLNHTTAFSVPPHGRLIDADALIDKVIAKYLEHERKGELVFAAAEIKQDIVDLISDAPTIFPAEEGET